MQPCTQHHFVVAGPLGRRHVRRDVGAVGNRPADGLQPREGGLLDDGFRESCGHEARRSKMQGSTSGVMIVVRSLARVTLTRKLYLAWVKRSSATFPGTIRSGFATIL